jgi:hypothetical protein
MGNDTIAQATNTLMRHSHAVCFVIDSLSPQEPEKITANLSHFPSNLLPKIVVRRRNHSRVQPLGDSRSEAI